MREPRTLTKNNTERSHKRTTENHHISIVIPVPRNSNYTENRDNIGPSSNNTKAIVTNESTCDLNNPKNEMHMHTYTSAKRMRNNRLQNASDITHISSTRPKLLAGGGQANPKKRKLPAAQTTSGARATRAAELERLSDTCTDIQFAEVLHDLPENWQSYNQKGAIITKGM